MKKLLVICVVMTLLVMLGASHLMAFNPRVNNAATSKLQNYSLLQKKGMNEKEQSFSAKGTTPLSLGAYAADGGSPGYIIGRSWRDDQQHGNPGRFVDWRTNPQIHFIYAGQQCGGHSNPDVCGRWMHYNMYDPTSSPNGVFVNGTQGVYMQTSPLDEGALYPNMDVDANGRIIVVGEPLSASAGSNFVRWVRVWWDISPSSWGNFSTDSIPDQVTDTGSVNFHYPITAYQEYEGDYITHVVAINGTGSNPLVTTLNGPMIITHWRKVSSFVTGNIDGTWIARQVADGPWTDAYEIAVSRDGAGKVAICYMIDRPNAAGTELWLQTSDDAGTTWNPDIEIVPFTMGEEGWQPWMECSLVYDSDNYIHALYNAQPFNGTTSSAIDPARVIHWTNRVVGSDAGGTTSTVDILDLEGLSDLDCVGSSNVTNIGKVSISECNNRLYSIWLAYGNLDFPNDCASDSVSDGFRGAVNADIMMNISLGLDGSLWDFRRNLTNSHSPECDGSETYPCDHDAFPSVSRHGMNTVAMGTTYWGAVPEAFEVRDALDNSWPNDGYFLDVQFTNDIIADVARYMDKDSIGWSNNPIKWFRLPCIPPIVEPRILVTTDDFIHPDYWVPSGTEVAFDLDLENVGNDILHITNVTSDAGSWLQINTTSLTVQAQEADIISLTLNPGSAINPTNNDAIEINAFVVIESDSPTSPDSFLIQSVITENVVAITTAVIRTGRGVPLIIANNGTAGNTSQGIPGTGGNLGFYEEGGIDDDLDSAAVYLYDASPILMYDNANYYWAPYWSPTDVDHATNFFPVPGGVLAEAGAGSGFDQYTTGQFVTGDSTIGMIKTWAAPDGLNVTYMIEKWQIYSYDGLAHPGLHVGEWVDMDVPSDTGANNYGEVIEEDDYLWVSGLEADFDGLVNSDTRFYTTGLLGYYWQSEYDADDQVNTTGLAGAYVTQIEDLMPANQEFDPDSVFNYLTAGLFEANNPTPWDDQRSLISIGQFDITENDTLVVWIVHGSMIDAATDGSDVAALIADAKVWYMANRDEVGVFGCCGLYTGGYPGNTNSDEAGLRDLADITKLIDNVYISKLPLVCPENGNVNGDSGGLVNLADITKLIDHVYISKVEVPNCI